MTRFLRSPDFRAEIEASEEYRTAQVKLAEDVAAEARAIAPDQTGAYRGSIKVIRLDDAVLVVTLDPFGHLIEFGSIKNPVYAPLRRAAARLGLRVQDDGPA